MCVSATACLGVVRAEGAAETEEAVESDETDGARDVGAGMPSVGSKAVTMRSCAMRCSNCLATPGEELISISHT